MPASGPVGDISTPLEWLLSGPNTFRYQLDDWITQTQTGLLWLPFEDAYRAVLQLMVHER